MYAVAQVVYGARTWTIPPGESAENLVTEEQHGTLPDVMAAALGVGKMRGGRPEFTLALVLFSEASRVGLHELRVDAGRPLTPRSARA